MNDNNGSLRVVDAKEMGEILSLSREQVWSLARQKIIPSYRINHLYRFDPEKVLAAVESNGNES